MKISEMNSVSEQFEKIIDVPMFDGIKMRRVLSYQDKLNFLEDVLTRSIDTSEGYYTPLAVELYIALDIIHFYTDLDIEDGTSIAEIYDKIKCSGLLNAVLSEIQASEIDILRDSIYATIDNLYKYRNSAYAIIENLSNIEGLEQNITDLVGKLKSAPEGLDLVKAAVDKLS